MSSVEYLGRSKPVNNCSPLVSVCVPTFQHADFIAECLDSILSQDTSFPIEIIVGEDQSSDGTREICIMYADKFPDKIRLFLNDREDVTFIDGRPSGTANLLTLLSESRGKFVALCEGDDYWTDKAKLELQVAILQKNLECSLVFHNSLIVYSDGSNKDFSGGLIEGYYDIETVITKPWFVPTQSILFRKELLDLGEWILHIYNCDYAIQLVLATKFPFYYVDKTMSVYRIHHGGFSSAPSLYYHQIKLVETLSIFNCISEFKFDRLVKKRLDDIRSGMLINASDEILRIKILGMRYWEKALTFRYYAYVANHILEKLRDKWVALRGRIS